MKLLAALLLLATSCTLYPSHHPRPVPNERVCKIMMAVEQCHAENSPAPFYLAIAEDGTWTIPDRRLQLRKRYCSEFWYGQERRPCDPSVIYTPCTEDREHPCPVPKP